MTRMAALLVTVAGLAAGLTGCGWVEWPPPGHAPRLANPPASRPADGGRAGSSPAFVGASAVIVGKGDTVYALSRRHGVSVRAIIEANRLEPPYLLRIGQRSR